MALRFGLHI